MHRPEVCLGDRGVVPDRGGRTGGDERAEVEDVDLVAQAEHEAHVVVDEENGDPAVAHRAQAVGQPPALSAIETGGRLVEEQQRRTAGQGTGDRDELALALGQLAHVALAERAKAEQVDRFRRRRS